MDPLRVLRLRVGRLTIAPITCWQNSTPIKLSLCSIKTTKVKKRTKKYKSISVEILPQFDLNNLSVASKLGKLENQKTSKGSMDPLRVKWWGTKHLGPSYICELSLHPKFGALALLLLIKKLGRQKERRKKKEERKKKNNDFNGHLVPD